jgi:hypothetical protein
MPARDNNFARKAIIGAKAGCSKMAEYMFSALQLTNGTGGLTTHNDRTVHLPELSTTPHVNLNFDTSTSRVDL